MKQSIEKRYADWLDWPKEDKRRTPFSHLYGAPSKHNFLIALAHRNHGLGIKQIGKRIGVPHFHVAAMLKPFGCKVAVIPAPNTHLSNASLWAGYVEHEIEAQARAERQHERWWRKAHPRSQMDRYYANLTESRKRSADNAKRLYDKMQKGSHEHMRRLLRARIYNAIKRQSKDKGRSDRKAMPTMQLVGCTTAQLRAHLESMFQSGMGWHNQGQWHIDHIIPCASFDLSQPDQQAKCFHWTNLQPLWAKDNLAKSDSVKAT